MDDTEHQPRQRSVKFVAGQVFNLSSVFSRDEVID